MTDTNNTDGAALLPVTQADREAAAEVYDHFHSEECFDPDCGHIRASGIRYGKYEDDAVVQILNRHRVQAEKGARDIVAAEKAHWLKEAMKHKRPSGRHSDCAARDLDRAKVAQRILDKMDAALTPSPLPATQEDAERSGVGSVDNLRAALRPFARAWQYWSDLKRLKPDADGVEEGPKGFVIWSEFKAAYEALSTPQRQEYDGEAVREALEQNRGPLADAARQIAVRFGVGGEGQASAYAAAKDAILAALAHPAQATPSAVSGDAGEGE